MRSWCFKEECLNTKLYRNQAYREFLKGFSVFASIVVAATGVLVVDVGVAAAAAVVAAVVAAVLAAAVAAVVAAAATDDSIVAVVASNVVATSAVPAIDYIAAVIVVASLDNLVARAASAVVANADAVVVTPTVVVIAADVAATFAADIVAATVVVVAADVTPAALAVVLLFSFWCCFVEFVYDNNVKGNTQAAPFYSFNCSEALIIFSIRPESIGFMQILINWPLPRFQWLINNWTLIFTRLLIGWLVANNDWVWVSPSIDTTL